MSTTQNLDLHVESWFDRGVIALGTLLFTLTILLATVQVVVRLLDVQVAGIPFHWTEPLARYCLVIATYVGAAVATRNDEHIRMDYFPNRLAERSPRAKRLLDVVVSVIVLAFALIVIRGTATMAGGTWGDQFGSVQVITSGMLYLGICLAFVLLAVYEARTLVGLLRAEPTSTDGSGVDS
ncbi:TRAP transporter small permease [Halorarum halobium]|uniref:TRAP transporter small permease n=1 Tax=Halorarum halobium TaxID=3075121 RepID=UPI0028AC1325|nr:TRAP transporter small permease [Halobaculum sp. XH14]